MNKTFICSDQHLDDGTGEFTKSGNAPLFMDFLDAVGNDDLVLLGDFLDFWRWEPRSILEGPHKYIIDRIRDKENVKLVLGNHDLRPSLMRRIFRGNKDIVRFLYLWDYKLMHGHQVDFLLDEPKERKLAFVLSRIIQTIDFGPLNKLRDWASSSNGSNATLINKLLNSGRKFIMGHSHTPVDCGWYINDGCCLVPGKISYVLIDEGGKAELKQLMKEEERNESSEGKSHSGVSHGLLEISQGLEGTGNANPP